MSGIINSTGSRSGVIGIVTTPTFSGDVTVTDGDLVIPTADKGIYFTGGTDPDTAGSILGGAAGNTLTDYEEGSWTATMGTGGGSITLDGSKDLLNYTKIGCLCHVSGRIKVSSISSPSGEISIAGLPFPGGSAGEHAQHQYIGVHFRGAVSDVGAVTGQVSTSSIMLYEAGTTGNTNVDSKIDGGTYIMIGGCYKTS